MLCSVFTKLNTLRDPGAYIGWVNRITANVCKLRLSKSGREVFLQSDEDGNDPFAMFEQVDESAVPDKAIDNVKGIPKKITINELYELQTNGLPKGMNGSTVRIELTADK